MTNQELIDLIEPLVDDTSISAVLDALTEICTRKGNLIQCPSWLEAADIINKAAIKTTKIKSQKITPQETEMRAQLNLRKAEVKQNRN